MLKETSFSSEVASTRNSTIRRRRGPKKPYKYQNLLAGCGIMWANLVTGSCLDCPARSKVPSTTYSCLAMAFLVLMSGVGAPLVWPLTFEASLVEWGWRRVWMWICSTHAGSGLVDVQAVLGSVFWPYSALTSCHTPEWSWLDILYFIHVVICVHHVSVPNLRDTWQ